MHAHLHKVEYLFFMNDDIILFDKNLITTLIENLEKNKDIGAIQPLIINKGGSLNCGFQSGFSSLSKVSKDGRGIFFISGAAF
jgi:GT2 family glycosyltransferase